jgi:hypothetical protein
LLQTFLTGTDAELASARQVQEAAHKATPAATVKGWFSSATSLLSGALGQQSQQPLSKDDLDCRKMVRYVQDLQREFTRLVAQMEELLPAQDKLGKAFGALGVAADSLAQAEGNPEHGKSADASAAAADGAAGSGAADADAPVEYSPPAASSSASSPSSEAAGAASMGLVGDEELSRMLHLLALSAEVVRQRTHAKGEQEDVEVLEPLKDACRQAHAVEVSNNQRAQLSPSPKQSEARQRCFSLTVFFFIIFIFFYFSFCCQLLLARREACLKECHELAAAQVGAARKLESSSAKAASSPSASADDKHAQRQQAADSSTFALLAKERELHAMTAAVRREFERAQAEKTAAVAFIVRSFIKLQIKHSEDNARTWAEMLTHMEKEPTAGADA